MKRLFFLLFTFIFLLVTPKSFAQAGWIIENFESNIEIQKTGEVLITEKIYVDFGSLEKHGIYRDIPYTYAASGKDTYTEIKIISVLQNGERAETKITDDNGYRRIRIGDPDRTISGRNNYEIIYAALGVLRGFPDYDELYWNVTGNNWETPIERASATVNLPNEGLLKFDCFEGYEGSAAECKIISETPRSVSFESAAPLDPYQGLTVVAGYEKGLVPLVTVERPLTFWEKFTQFPSLATLFSILTFGIGTIIYIWYKFGRDYWYGNTVIGEKTGEGRKRPVGAHETTVVEYTPPEKMSPAMIGVLVDERAHTHDVVATIIDLAGRGFLSIREIDKKWLFGKIDYELKKTDKSEKDLLGYEKLLLEKLFDAGNTVKISALKNSFYTDLKKVKDALYDEVVAGKLFSSNPEKVRQKYLIIAILIMFFSFFLIGLATSGIVIFANLFIGSFTSGLVLLIFSFFMPRRTAHGRELYRRVKGYRLFIDKAETHRQKFFENKNMFNETLPYAIVFGLTGKFAKAMKEIGIKPDEAVSWYVGTRPFNLNNFESSMSDFSKSVSSAIASTPSSSGGFSGGGSSGGGFGGGGGGSW